VTVIGDHAIYPSWQTGGSVRKPFGPSALSALIDWVGIFRSTDRRDGCAISLSVKRSEKERTTEFVAKESTTEIEQSSERAATQPSVDPKDIRDIRMSLAGDGDAFARLVRRYQEEIGRYMWRFTRDARMWEELVHDVFVQAFTSLKTFRGKAPLLHWLRRLATRVGYAHWKQEKRNRTVDSLPVEQWQELVATEDGSIEAIEAGELVEQLLGQVSQRDRLVLTLVYIEGHTIAEAAELTGWTKTMTKVQLHRARIRLKKLLESLEAQ